MMRTLNVLLVVGVLALVAAPALAEGGGILRGGVTYVLPGGDAKFKVAGDQGSLEVDSSFGLYIGYEFMINDLFGIDTSVAWQDHDYTAYVPGNDPNPIEGSVGNIPLEVAFNFHVLRGDWGTFYVGAIGGYNFAQDRANNSVGWGAQAGADIKLTDSGLLLNMATSYMWISQDWDLTSSTISYDINPWTFRFGLGYRF